MSGDLEKQAFSIEDDDECVVGAIDDDDECEIEEIEDGNGSELQGLTPANAAAARMAMASGNSEIDDIINKGDHNQQMDSLVKDGIMNCVVGTHYTDNDDDSHDQHDRGDQLPSVEEVKSYQAYIPTAALIQKGYRRKYMKYCGAFIVLISIIVGITFGVIAAKNKKKNKSVDPMTTFSPRTNEVIQWLFEQEISSLPALQLRGTPEHYAAAFVSDGDLLNLNYTAHTDQFIERYTLAMLYYALDGTHWTDGYKFMKGYHHCEWNQVKETAAGDFIKGVECDKNKRVIGLDLAGNNLKGPMIPTEIVQLQKLEKLHLHHNELGANIPNLTPMKNLKSVGFMHAGLKGTIPDWFGNMPQLTTLALSHNPFYKGTIPKSFNKLKNMRVLGLDSIQLTGTLEPIKMLHNLEVLYLNNNSLTGDLDQTNWNSLIEFDLSSNEVGGTIPPKLYQYPKLQVLDINKNHFTGPFPDDIMPNDSLEYFAMQENKLTGSLSDRIGFLTNLKHFDVGSNELTGTIPDTIQRLTNLVSFSTSVNKFSKQPIHSEWYRGMTKLQAFSMKANHLTGGFPQELEFLTHLKILDLDSNHLKGTIPTEVSLLSNLQGLLLNRNEFSGKIPHEIKDMQFLDTLLLDGNNLTGSTQAICLSERGMTMSNFITDCYPSNYNDKPEVECRCCTLCCNDADPECNNKKWTINNDVITNYGDTRIDYDYHVDQAPKGWWGKAYKQAMSTSF